MNNQNIEEIKELLRNDTTQVGETFRLMEEGTTKATELVEKGSGANTGVINIHKAIIKATLEGEFPKGAYVSLYSARTIKRLLELGVKVSPETKRLLEERRSQLLAISEDTSAVQKDTKEFQDESERLVKQLKDYKNAIYVYTFPTYYRVGVDGDPEIKWLKIGKTTNSVWDRVSSQNRDTVMPEDPIIVRIYHKDGMDLDDIETKFHQTLKDMFHKQGALQNRKGGTEWFATSEISLDAIANLLGLNIVRAMS